MNIDSFNFRGDVKNSAINSKYDKGNSEYCDEIGSLFVSENADNTSDNNASEIEHIDNPCVLCHSERGNVHNLTDY